jgi:1-deoxy-D-xylulose-5-phosphate synthase
MQRAFDQVLHDVALQKLNVVFCLDRGGLVGADGPTHHGAYDIAYMRCIPNMVVSSPMNESELRSLMYSAQMENQGPFTIRYPRGNGVLIDWKTPMEEIKVGTGRRLTNGSDIAFLTLGPIGNYTTRAIQQLSEQGIDAAHYDMRFAKPIDEVMLHEVFGKFKNVITIEDGCIQGGMGSAVLEFMADHGYTAKVRRLGIPDAYIEHGTQDELYKECGFDVEGMVAAAHSMLEHTVQTQTA